MKWLRRKKQSDNAKDVASSIISKHIGPPIRISIEERLVFSGRVESFDIDTGPEGSDARCFITFKATDIVKELNLIKDKLE